MRSDSDLTARARIRDAALDLFGREGVNRVSVRAIAAQAGVSPALVLHHFGSKDGLRKACDAYLVEMLRGDGTSPDLDDTSRIGSMIEDATPIRRYLARAFLDESPDAAALFDSMVAGSERWLEQGVAEGWVRPAADPHARAAIYVGWLLTPVVLHAHLARALGEDDLAETGATLRFSGTALEMLTQGVFADERVRSAYEKVRNERS
ncbi:TetR/AcrR family transcriptional regulator [Nonomuraea endophytica]|uniref:AcrR family transcriptional regulator n=1 Tax=Nonomuraea endophytica TaxID=714136 RepID=A0A7W8AFK1_9ACTN|nr:TetR family transcriptional regulator [Nonomuraea endophytica]MBB5084769.1 AcrR family transcriptional regulator [Nonomuraea endophytica]